MTRVLVIQLCRAGDLLQTVPMLRGLRRWRRDARVELLVRDSFAWVPLPPGLVDRTHVFPHADLSGRDCGGADWRDAAARLRALLDGLGADGPYDAVFNLSHTDLAGLLTRLLPAADIHGGTIADDRTRVVRGPWMQYLWSSQAARSRACFNLVDVYNWSASVPSDRAPLEIGLADADRRWADQWLRQRQIAGRPVVAVQLGASDEQRRWPAESFAAAIDAGPGEQAAVVLVGVAGERPLLTRYAAVARAGWHDALGQTTFPQLAALLERCQLLLSNDTGTAHVGSAVGTRVICLATGPALAHETGPYGEGHLWLEPILDCSPCAAQATCSHLMCRDAYSPREVAALLQYALGHGELPRFASARLLASRCGDRGEVVYEPVDGVEHHPGEIVRAALRQTWFDTLPRPAAGWQDLRQPTPRAAIPVLTDVAHVKALRTGLEQLERAVGAVRQVALHLAGGHVDAQASSQMERRLQGVRVAASLAPAGEPIAAYLRLALDSLTTPEPAQLARHFIRECSLAIRRTRLLRHRLCDGLDLEGRASDTPASVA